MNDNIPTPEWLKCYFEGWYDPCPINTGELREFDGLGEWRDKTFVNIPYSDPMPWCKRAVEESKKGKRIVLLTRVDPSTKWWLVLVGGGFRVAFFHGRIKFTNDKPANFASALWFGTGAKG